MTFPELSAQGAYNMHMIYSQSEIKEIIEYARLRGIRTLAEFDTPGHTRSWGVSHPELLTACEGVFRGKLGPMDPTNEDTYIFMQKLLAEIGRVFPDEYIHLGGDEGEQIIYPFLIFSIKFNFNNCFIHFELNFIHSWFRVLGDEHKDSRLHEKRKHHQIRSTRRAIHSTHC